MSIMKHKFNYNLNIINIVFELLFFTALSTLDNIYYSLLGKMRI